MKVLLFGGTGFIGTRVADELILGRGSEVRVTVRDYRKAIRLGRLPVEWVDAPVADVARMRDAAQGCDAVVSCAHPFGSPREAEAALEICRSAAAAAAATTTRRLVFLSSTAVYGTRGGDVDPDVAPKPDTAYGSIKMQCEALLAREHDAGAIRLVVLRPSIVYGPFSPSWTSLPARQMRSGDLVLPAGATGACNAVYVDDVAQAVAAAVALDTSARVTVNVSGPDRLTWRQFYGGYESVVRPGSIVEWTLEAIAAAGERRERERRGWSALKRAMRDQTVRERLNEIPVLSKLNQFGKSFGWSGLPPVAAGAAAAAAPGSGPAFEPHVPTPMLLDLYLRAPHVGSAPASDLLGLSPRGLAAGMAPTLEWLRWAGLTAERPGVTAPRSAAFVIPHPYVDALACFREPIKYLADAGWHVDLYTMLSPLHPAPFFGRANVRLVPLEMTPRGAIALVSRLVLRRPKYDWIVAVPQWALHYASQAARFAGIPMGCISDELRSEAEAVTDQQRSWRARERRAHRSCRWTIALSQARADFVRQDNRLGQDHRIFVVPNAAPGAARRLKSRYYQDVLDLPDGARILLHAGSLWWTAANELIESSPAWTSDWTVVFQGRFVAPRDWRDAPAVRLSEQVLPASLLDYAASSATIGLALYDASRDNNRLMGTASGKVALYMKNALPVIATDQSGLDWLEREQCGVVVSSIHDIPAAADRIWLDYDTYVRNVRRCFDATLEFGSHFRPVAELMSSAGTRES